MAMGGNPDNKNVVEVIDIACEECRAALLKASKGKLDENFIEGMACVGGCSGGAACLSLNHAMKNRMSIDNYAKQAHKGLSESVSVR